MTNTTNTPYSWPTVFPGYGVVAGAEPRRWVLQKESIFAWIEIPSVFDTPAKPAYPDVYPNASGWLENVNVTTKLTWTSGS